MFSQINDNARYPERPIPGGDCGERSKGECAVLELMPLAAIAPEATDTLLDSAFGTDRRARTAYKIRAGTEFDPSLSFAAGDGPTLVGVIQCWPVVLTLDGGGTAPLVMIGPVAVLPDRQRDGIGRMLMNHMLAEAERTGQDRALMLIGDPEYYGRFFGFSSASTGYWRVPGPIDQHRLLARGPDVPAVAGMLGPHIVAIA